MSSAGARRPLGFTDVHQRDWLGQHSPDLADLRALFEGLVELPATETPDPEGWRRVLPGRAQFVRLLGERTAHVHLRGAPAADLAVKLLLPSWEGRHWRRVTGRVHSRAHLAFRWGSRLRGLGIDVPRPLGYLERAEHPALDKSFVVTQYIYVPVLLHVEDAALGLERPRRALLEHQALSRTPP